MGQIGLFWHVFFSAHVGLAPARRRTATLPLASAALSQGLYLPLVAGGAGNVVTAAAADGMRTTKYYHFNGQTIALWRSDRGLRYLHGDHLGSPVLETDRAGRVAAQGSYAAFGRPRQGGPKYEPFRISRFLFRIFGGFEAFSPGWQNLSGSASGSGGYRSYLSSGCFPSSRLHISRICSARSSGSDFGR